MSKISIKNCYYLISSDFKLLDFNDSVAETYKGVKVGDYCYKATMKRDTPCAHCPLAGNTDAENPIYYDPYVLKWMEAIFTDAGDGKYAVICREAKDRGMRVFNSLGKEETEAFIEELSGTAANNKLRKLAKDLEDANEEQGAQLEEIRALNEELEEQQKRMEDLACEQEAQIEEITSLNESLKTANEDISKMYGMVEGLSHEYHTICLVYADTLKKKLIRSSGSSTLPGAILLDKIYDDYDENFRNYIKKYVVKKDRNRVRRAVKASNVISHLEKRESYSVNYLREGDDGKISHHQVVFIDATTPDGKKNFIYGLRDVDKLTKADKRAKQELEDARKAAEAANNAKTAFLFNMSHDIRTPMNAIMGFRDLLEKHQEDPEKRADYLAKIADASNVLLSIINNVLEMARIEKGTLELDDVAWSAEQFSDSIYSIFLEMMKEKEIEYTRTVDVKHKYVFCDTIKLREIYINILSNAYKYTNPGGKVSMELVEVPCSKRGYAKYQTTITDTGIGMSEDFLPHLYEEFSREQTSTVSKIEGTGLGMPIVKRLVDIMGGEIDVKSERGKGTTFVVTMTHKIAKKEDLVGNSGVEIDPTYFKGQRILLAEDNDLNAEIAMAILGEAGFIVERAINGLECIDMLKASATGYYDLILMDIQMPQMNGYNATRSIRMLEDPDKSHIPILAMTANAFEEDKREALRSGMNGHIPKPINVRELYRELATVLIKHTTTNNKSPIAD